MQSRRHVVGAALVLAGALSAQWPSYTTFGQGCSGTGPGGQFPGLVLPKGHDQKWGNYNNIWGVSAHDQRYQQVFLASEIGSSMVFTGYQLRPDDSYPATVGGVQTYSVSLGYTLRTPASLNSVFASNYDTARGAPTQLFSGTVNLPPYSGSPSLQDWDVTIRFTRPWLFAYVPGENLLFELANTSSYSIHGLKDAVTGPNANTAFVAANGGAALTSGLIYRDAGLVIKFNMLGGGGGSPTLTATGLPIIGAAMSVQLAHAKANSAALLALGGATSSWLSIPLPLDLTMLGAPSCALLVSPDVFVAVPTDAQGAANVPFGIPNDQALAGVVFHNQWFVVDAGANGLGLAFSNGGTGTIY